VKIHRDIQQSSVEWLVLRSGKVTASNADALVSPLGKVRTGEGVKTFLAKMLAEAWIGGPLPSVQGVFDCEQGKILEEEAKPAFTLETGIQTQDVAFVETDDGRAGCSPDAGIFDGEKLVGGVEIKCPRMETHIGYLLAGKLPADYVAQVQFSLYVTGAANWHFFSYRRNFPPLHLVIEPDPQFQEAIRIALESFYSDFDDGWRKLVDLNGGLPLQAHRGIAPLPNVKTQSYSEQTGDIVP
jgi:YqaJ-like viral recombinase domain